VITSYPSIFPPVTFGRQSRCREQAGIRIVETIHAPDVKLDRHDHEDPTIVVAISGGWDERVDNRSFICRPGSFIVKPAGAKHANVYGFDSTRSIVIQLTITRTAASESAKKVFCAPAHFESPKLARRLVPFLWNAAEHSDLEVEEHVCLLLSLIASEKTPGRRAPALVSQLKRIRDELMDEPSSGVDLTTLGRRCGMTPSAFTHAFRSEFACTPSSLIRRRRVEKAAFLLRTSSHSLSQIAANTGFADQSHLTRELKRLTGATPARYRQLTTL
jgi:AraC family transcriptional regulator